MIEEMLKKIYNINKNLIINGDLSVGKTRNIIIPLVDKMINNDENLIVLDAKEEYLKEYYNKLKDKDYNIVILNFRDLNKSEGWNPLEYPYNLYKNNQKDKAVDYLNRIGNIMFYEGTSQDPFWSNSASDFFTGITLGLFEDGTKNTINLNSVNSMFNGVDKKYGSSDYLTKYFDLKDKNSSSYIYASGTCYSPKETRGGILSVARQKLGLYTSREMLSTLLSKTTFDLDSLSQKKTAIFIIGKDEDKSINTLPAIFIEQLFEIIIDNNNSKNYNFVLDNFDIIDKINNFSNMFSSGLSRGIKFIVGTRSIDDVISKYGEYLNKLCKVINVSDNKIEFNIDNKKEIIDNSINQDDNNICNIEYPNLPSKKIESFDLVTFVADKCLKNIYKENPELKQPKEDEIKTTLEQLKEIEKQVTGFNIDELLSRIDDKIAQLDRMEDK